MAFALSDANPAWCEGPRAGLGSSHTPGPWTLGDIQAWLSARIIGDEAGAARSLRRLADVAFADNMLPEAYNVQGDERIRHWFAWPGAALAAFRLLDRDGTLQPRLSVLALARG
jgi:meiotically up-regulated gene 157 (Mug157) protein